MDTLLGRIETLDQVVQSLTQQAVSTPYYAARFTPLALGT